MSGLKSGIDMKKLYLAAALLLAGSYSAVSQAACTFSSGSATDGQTVNFGNVVIQRDAPIGTVVASVTATQAPVVMCDTPGGYASLTTRWVAEGMTTITYNGEQLFSVGIAGLAMRVVTPGAGSTTGQYGSGAFPRDIRNAGCSWQLPSFTWAQFCSGSFGSAIFQLVKIASVTGSGATNTPGRMRSGIVNLVYTYSVSFGESTISTVACTVSNTSIPITMDKVSTKDFTGVGTTASTKAVTIPLNCNAGTKVNVTLDGTHHSSGVAGVLALDSASTTVATGLGLQLLYNNTAVTLGTPIAVGTTTSSGAYNVGLTARYYQTAATVTAGQANSTATFTMTYN